MTKIKITSNPYDRELLYLNYNEQIEQWENIKNDNPNSRLREYETDKTFLPFKIKEIIDTIIEEYYAGTEQVQVIFEGTRDDYSEIETICADEEVKDKIKLSRSEFFLENARDIFKDIKEIFDKVQPIIEGIIRNDTNVLGNLNKVSDALNDIIPICVFGNYSAGKSTFINALLGSEVLPSGGDPVTAKIYRIEHSTQADRAKITFSYKEEKMIFCFEGNSYRVLEGDAQNELVREIYEEIEADQKRDMFSMINCALALINGFEKKNKTSTIISSVIELEIPFSKNGILGKSDNRFVIFDTPGSNSASNSEHSKVLAEALEGFSNGIPVWITQYEAIDSEDNANLCDRILEIPALDNRFTMIILNKADGSDLPENGFTEEQVEDILEYNAVEKMYASGIYFVSAIMGLGAKQSGKLADKHYRKTYRAQLEMYSDPDDPDYAALYHYNIMPEQVKDAAVRDSLECSDLVYANSGLFCVEKEMENFASKHSAYNKCQMVYRFLNEVIGETNRRITAKTEFLKGTREQRQTELEAGKQELIDSIIDISKAKEEEFHKESEAFIKDFVSENLIFSHTEEEIEEMDSNIRNQNTEKSHFSIQEKEYEDSIDHIWNHLKLNGQSLFKKNLVDSFKAIKDDFVRDYKELQANKDDKEFAEREIDKATSDTLLQIVSGEYRSNILSAKDCLSLKLKEYWHRKAQELRNELITIITGSDALSTSQRDELSDIIINYQPIEFKDDADNIFIKKRFLRGNVLGIILMDSERLNTKRLTNIFNDKMRKNVAAMASAMNESSYISFTGWEKSLSSIIEANITEYNPQLRNMAEMIREETEKINELEANQQTICTSLDEIRELMEWKTVK